MKSEWVVSQGPGASKDHLPSMTDGSNSTWAIVRAAEY